MTPVPPINVIDPKATLQAHKIPKGIFKNQQANKYSKVLCVQSNAGIPELRGRGEEVFEASY